MSTVGARSGPGFDKGAVRGPVAGGRTARGERTGVFCLVPAHGVHHRRAGPDPANGVRAIAVEDDRVPLVVDAQEAPTRLPLLRPEHFPHRGREGQGVGGKRVEAKFAEKGKHTKLKSEKT